MMPRSIIFVRHAQSIGNTMTQDQRAVHELPNHVFPLTDTGQQQAELAGRYLKGKLGGNVSRIFFQSTFLRTQQTMGIILNELEMSPLIFTDSRLDEKWDGIFHELTNAEIEISYPEQIRLRKRSGYYHYRAPGGESCPDTELRIRSFLSDPMVVNQHVVIVGHGRWAILLHKIIFDLTVEEFLKLKKSGLKDGGTENCSVIEYSGRPLSYKCVVPWKDQLSEQKTELA